MNVENVIYDTPVGKSGHIMLKFDSVVNEILKAEVRQSIKRRYNYENYTTLNYMIDLCGEGFSEMYSEGEIWVPLTSNTEGMVRKRKELCSKRYQRAMELQDVMKILMTLLPASICNVYESNEQV